METCLLPLGAQTLAQVYQGWARSMKSLRKKKKIALTKGNPEGHEQQERENSGSLGPWQQPRLRASRLCGAPHCTDQGSAEEG